MPLNSGANENEEKIIKDVILKHNLEDVSNIVYKPGSKKGDGYLSKTYAVDINHRGGTTHVFLKTSIHFSSSNSVPVENYYFNEIYFYETVYPAYRRFLLERNVKNGFRNAPRCYSTSVETKIIALENLRQQGYTMFNRKRIMDEKHIQLVLKTYAKFHAIGYAFKHQQNNTYTKLIDDLPMDMFLEVMGTDAVVKVLSDVITGFLGKLDPVKDKYILDNSKDMAETLIASTTSESKYINEYSTLTQGDCWCNNIMFSYGVENPEEPSHVKLVDWQLIRVASPVFDISYFFYTIASQETVDKLDYYLKVYHDELSEQITKLGGDPETLYPFRVLKDEWKQHGKFGVAMAFCLIRFMLAEEDEVISIDGASFDSDEDMQKFIQPIKNEEKFVDRLKVLTEHLMRNDYL